jgi:hypothetical protein
MRTLRPASQPMMSCSRLRTNLAGSALGDDQAHVRRGEGVHSVQLQQLQQQRTLPRCLRLVLLPHRLVFPAESAPPRARCASRRRRPAAPPAVGAAGGCSLGAGRVRKRRAWSPPGSRWIASSPAAHTWPVRERHTPEHPLSSRLSKTTPASGAQQTQFNPARSALPSSARSASSSSPRRRKPQLTLAPDCLAHQDCRLGCRQPRGAQVDRHARSTTDTDTVATTRQSMSAGPAQCGKSRFPMQAAARTRRQRPPPQHHCQRQRHRTDLCLLSAAGDAFSGSGGWPGGPMLTVWGQTRADSAVCGTRSQQDSYPPDGQQCRTRHPPKAKCQCQVQDALCTAATGAVPPRPEPRTNQPTPGCWIQGRGAPTNPAAARRARQSRSDQAGGAGRTAARRQQPPPLLAQSTHRDPLA